MKRLKGNDEIISFNFFYAEVMEDRDAGFNIQTYSHLGIAVKNISVFL